MSEKELSYQLYSEFKNSNWYIYWDKEYAYLKETQLLVVWHIASEVIAYYDYGRLEVLLKSDKMDETLPYFKTLPEDDKTLFTSICHEFIEDVNYKFKRT